MRMRWSGWALLALLFVACGSSVRSEDTRMYDRDVSGAEVLTRERFGVELPSNPSTGYQWRLAEPLEEEFVTLVGSDYQESDSDAVGAGGTETWVFRAVGQGTTTIRLEYVRAWEENPVPADTWRLTIHVRRGSVSCSASS
ncbi:MAG: protease inhibitor I42 family protein [Nitrospinae bacterium]|nr:protease inhibitor I42 family protein [Nitrospinota bacterium]